MNLMGLQHEKSPHALHFRYWDDGIPVGEAQLHSDSWVWAVEVYVEFRGNGFGRQIMDAVETHARAMAMSELNLWVTHGNARALAMYESLGYDAVLACERGTHMRKVL